MVDTKIVNKIMKMAESERELADRQSRQIKCYLFIFKAKESNTNLIEVRTKSDHIRIR